MARRTKDNVFRVATGLHEFVFRATKGRILGRAAGMPVLLLGTTGRRTGRGRSTMLTSPVQEGDRIVLVASYGGDDRDPAWFRNVSANPQVEVTMGGSTRRMLARVASPAEKAELWPRITAAYRGYGSYQRRTDRDIPVVILEPA